MTSPRPIESYKAVYAKLEELVKYDFEIPAVIRSLSDVLSNIDSPRMDDAHKNFLLATALPRILHILLKSHKGLSDSLTFKIHKFLRIVLVAVTKSIQVNLQALVEILALIFSPDLPVFLGKTLQKNLQYQPDPTITSLSMRRRRVIIASPAVAHKLRVSAGARRGRTPKGKDPVNDQEDIDDFAFPDIHQLAPRPAWASHSDEELSISHLETSSDEDTYDSSTMYSDPEDSDTEEDEPGAGATTLSQLLDQADTDPTPFSSSSHRAFGSSDWVSDSINCFGHCGGFSVIVKHIASSNCPLSYAALLLQLWGHLMDDGFVTATRMQKYIIAIEKHFLLRMRKLDAQDVRLARKEDIEAIAKYMTVIFKCYNANALVVARAVEPIILHAYKQFLLFAPIDKRVQALQQFISFVEAAQSHEHQTRMVGKMAGVDPDFADTGYVSGLNIRSSIIKYMSTTELAYWFRDNRIVEVVFDTQRHSQLVSKCGPLVRFLVSVNISTNDGSRPCIANSALDAIWLCATTSQEMTVADDTFNLLNSISSQLHVLSFEHLMEIVAPAVVSSPTNRVITFCAHLARVARESIHRSRILDALWTVAVLDSVKPELSSFAASQLVESLKSESCARHRRAFIFRAIQFVQHRQGNSQGIALRVANGALRAMPVSVPAAELPSSPRGESVSELINLLQKEFNFFGLLLNELTEWKAACRAAIASANPPPTHTSVLSGRMSFIEELRFRLEVLFIGLSHTIRMSHEFLPLIAVLPTQVWEIVIDGALFDEERSEAFLWFHAARDLVAGGICPVSPSVAQHIFQQKMLNLDFSSRSICNMTFFKCFTRYFVDVNVANNRLAVPAGANPASVTSEVNSLVPIDEILGSSAYWTMAIESLDTAVAEASIDMLVKLTERVDSSVSFKLNKWNSREHYIKSCLNRLQATMRQSATPLPELVRHRILRCLKLLTSLLDYCEPAINSEPTKTRAAPLRIRVKVILDVSNAAPLKFSVDAEDSMQFKDVYQRIMVNLKTEIEKYEMEPRDLVLLDPSRPGSTLDLQGDDEVFTTKSIREIGLEDGQTLVFRRATTTKGRETAYRLRSNLSEMLHQKPPLDAAQKAQEVSEISGLSIDMSLFALRKNRWDVHATVDVLMDDSRKSSLIAEARRSGVSEQTTSSAGPTSASSALGLDEYLKVMAARTRLLLSASADESLTESVDHAMQKHISNMAQEASMPSVILSRQPDSFNLLFAVLRFEDAQISSPAWKLVWRMPVPQFVKAGLLAGISGGDSESVPDWEALLPSSPEQVHDLQYALALMDQIVFPLDSTQVVQKRVEWAHWFLSTGGGVRLLNILLDKSLQLKQETFLLLLKLSHFFWSACLYSEASVPELDNTSLDEFAAFVQNISTPDLSLPLTQEVTEKAVDSLLAFLTGISRSELSADCISMLYYAWRLLILVFSKVPEEGLPQLKSKHAEVADCGVSLLTLERGGQPHVAARVRYQTAAQLAQLTASSELQRVFLDRLSVLLSEDNLVDASKSTRLDGVFHLMGRIVKRSVSVSGVSGLQQFAPLLETLSRVIVKRPVTEVGASSVPDDVLSGALNLASVLVKRWPSPVSDNVNDVSLVWTLFHDCLFAQKTARLSLPKCKTPKARQACFKLLKALSKNSPNGHMILLTKYLTTHQLKSFDSAALGVWDIASTEEERAASGYVGLHNLGATCYANSLLQQMFMMPAFRQDVLQAPIALSDSKSFLTASSMEENMVFQLQRIFGFLQESEKSYYNPKEFCSSFRDLGGQPMNVSMQQDVNEFFNIVCQRIEAQLKGTPHAGLLSKHFAGAVANELRVVNSEFPYSSERAEEFYAVPVDVKHKRTLEEALDLYIQPERLEGDNKIYVDKYARKLDAVRISSLKTLPPTIIFHLKRFDYDVGLNRRSKINDRFEFPMKINLKPWTREGIAEREGRSEDAKCFQEEAAKTAGVPVDDVYHYELTGILIHSGSADSGHYYSLVRERDGNQRWLQFNDRVVSNFDPHLIPNESFGGTQIQSRWDSAQKKAIRKEVPVERSAYMLFYERIAKAAPAKHEEIHVVESSPPTSQSPTSPSQPEVTAKPDPLASSRIPAATTTAGVLDALLLAHKQTHPETSGLQVSDTTTASSATASVPAPEKYPAAPISHDLVQGVPKPIFDAVWQDNSKFLRDRNSYDPLYFEFVLSLLVQLESRLKELDKPLFVDNSEDALRTMADDAASEKFLDTMLIKFAVRLFVEVVLRTKNASCIPWWTAQLRRIFRLHHSSLIWFVDYIRRNGLFKDALLVCPRERTRIEFEDLCVDIMRVASNYSIVYNASVPSPSAVVGKDTAWHASPNPQPVAHALLLSAWELFDESRPHWKRFKQYFAFIRDFALLGRSNRELLIRLNLIVKYTDYFMGSGPYSAVSIMDEQNLPDLVEFVDTLTVLFRGSRTDAPADAPPSPYRLDDDPAERLPATSLFALFDSKFFGIALDMQYNVQSITQLIQHASWHCPERSDMILESMLKTFQQGATHRLPGFEYQLAGLLNIPDVLQEKRVRRALTSFKFGATKSRGMMAHVMEMHSRNNKDPTSVDIARFICVLARDIPAVFNFMCRRQHDLEWLRDFLEMKVEELLSQTFSHASTSFRMTDSIILEDAKERHKQLSAKIVGYQQNSLPVGAAASKDSKVPPIEFLHQDPTYASLIFVTWCLMQADDAAVATAGTSDDQVFKLAEQVSQLQYQVKNLEKDRSNLIDALRYCVETGGIRLPFELMHKVSSMLPSGSTSPRGPNWQAGPQSQALVVHPASNGPENVGAGAGAAWAHPNVANIPLKNLVDAAGASAPAAKSAAAGKENAADSGRELSDVPLSRMGDSDDDDDDNDPGLDDGWSGRDAFNTYGPHRPDPTTQWYNNGWAREQEPPANIGEKLESLRCIFEDTFDEGTLTESLRSNNWDPDAAAEALFDPSQAEKYKAEALRRKEKVPQVNAYDPYQRRLNVSGDDLSKIILDSSVGSTP